MIWGPSCFDQRVGLIGIITVHQNASINCGDNHPERHFVIHLRFSLDLSIASTRKRHRGILKSSVLTEKKKRRILLVIAISFYQLAQRGLEGYAMNKPTTFRSVIPEEPEGQINLEVAHFREHFEGRRCLDQLDCRGAQGFFSRPLKWRCKRSFKFRA